MPRRKRTRSVRAQERPQPEVDNESFATFQTALFVFQSSFPYFPWLFDTAETALDDSPPRDLIEALLDDNFPWPWRVNGAAALNSSPSLQGVSSEDLVRHTSRFSCCRTHQQASAMCSVCQEEFRLREHIRELRCTHRFHRRCIDRWLSSHSTCPLCVQPVVPPVAASATSTS